MDSDGNTKVDFDSAEEYEDTVDQDPTPLPPHLVETSLSKNEVSTEGSPAAEGSNKESTMSEGSSTGEGSNKESAIGEGSLTVEGSVEVEDPAEVEVPTEVEVPAEGPGKDPIGEVPVEVEDPTKILSASTIATYWSNMLNVEIKPPSTGSPFSPGEIALIQTFIQMCNCEKMELDSIQKYLGLGSATLFRSSSAMSVYVARMGKGY